MKRRQLLIASVGTLLTTISGCSGSTGDSPQSNADGDSSQNNDGDGSPGENSDEGPNDDIGNYDPEDVARSYYEALNKGDVGAADALSHSDGVAILTHESKAKQWGDSYEITIDRTEVTMEDLPYFYQPSAVVDVGFEQARKENSTSRVTRDQVILVVENGELLVYDTKGQNRYLRTEEPPESCFLGGENGVLDLLPPTTESFYEVSRDESFGNGDAEYRGPDGNWFYVEIGVHDSEDEAKEVVPGVDVTHSTGDSEWTSEVAMVGRDGNMTIDVQAANADETDKVEALYEAAGCFTQDSIVERSW